MSRRKWLSSVVDNPELNPTQWLEVQIGRLPTVKKSRFRQRKRALDLYFSGELTVKKILRKTGLSKPEFYRVRNRALSTQEDGKVWGYLACIPGHHTKAYERKMSTTTGRAGTVTRFFSEFPELLELVTAWAIGKKSPDVGVVRGRQIARICVGFEKACVEKKISLEDAPSREAIRRLCTRIRKQHFRRSSRLVRGKAAGDIASSGLGGEVRKHATVPYQQTQMDGHRLDALITMDILDSDGTRRDLPLERLWLLAVIDVASRAILGYQISLASNYTSDDVLDCIAHSLEPWTPKDLPSDKIAYRKDAGLPSGVINGCAWRGFDSLAFDNAMSHTSVWMQERIIRTVGCEINTGRPARALSRAIVERFFRTFEDESLHRWPSTTGSGPSDPRRTNPDKEAERLKITLEDLEVIIDLTIANYNATPHKSLNGRTPLEYIRYYNERGLALPRYLPPSITDCLPLYDRQFSRQIAGNVKTGRRPYVTFMGAHYRNEGLATLIDRIGEKITLVVNVRDIRRVQAYLSNGTCIGTLIADDPWLRQPHSLRTRRAIMKLVKNGELSRETYNPVGDHLNYLVERAKLTRRDRNRLLQQCREAGVKKKPALITHPKTPQHHRVQRRHHIRISGVHSN